MNNITMWLIRLEISAMRKTRTRLEAFETSLSRMWNQFKSQTKTLEKDLRDLEEAAKALREQ